MAVAAASFFRQTRVLAQARHQVRGAQCVDVADQRLFEVQVAHHRGLKQVFLSLKVLLVFEQTIIDWVTNDEQIVFHDFDEGIEFVVECLVEQVLGLGVLEVIVEGCAHL